MKKLMLLSLFSVFGIVANRPHIQKVQDEFRTTSSDGRDVHNAWLEIETELKKTQDGIVYYNARKEWFECDRLHGHASTACSYIQQDLERTLALVREMPLAQLSALQDKNYLKERWKGLKLDSVLQDKDYLFERWKNLELMISFMDNESYASQSEQDVLHKAINAMEISVHRQEPSTMWIEMANDLKATQEKVKENLRGFVQGVTKN